MTTDITHRSTRTEFRWLIAAVWAVMLPAAFAQQIGTNSPTGKVSTVDVSALQEAGGIALGPITAYPSVKLEFGRDDNLYQNPNNRISDSFAVSAPSVRFEARQGANTYNVVVGSTLGRYDTRTADNYTNYNVNGLAELDLSARFRANIKADYINWADARGSNNTPISATPDQYHESYLGGVGSYGAKGAEGRIDLELGQRSRRYDNNRARTSTSDHDTADFGATFYWRIAPKTSLLLQAKQSKVDYMDPASIQSSTENRLLAGVTWAATAKTTGTFKLGMVKKSFDNSALSSSSDPSWEATIKWSPLTYSQVDFNLSRMPAETTGGVGNFVDKTITGATWSHAWTRQFATEVAASYTTEDYKGFARQDNTRNFGLKATYTMRRWLSFGAGYIYSSRDSNINTSDYDRNKLMLFVNATL